MLVKIKMLIAGFLRKIGKRTSSSSIFLRINLNRIGTQKSIGLRIGGGKGKFSGTYMYLLPGMIFLEFNGFDLEQTNQLVFVLKKRFGLYCSLCFF